MRRKYYQYLIRYMIIWTVAFAFFTFLREHGQEVIREFRPLAWWEQLRINATIGVIAVILFGTVGFVFEKYIFKKTSFGRTMLIGLTSYIFVSLIFIGFGMRVFTHVVGQEFNWKVYGDFVFSSDVLVVIVYFLVMGFLIDLFSQDDKNLGPGILWKVR